MKEMKYDEELAYDNENDEKLDKKRRNNNKKYK